MRKINLYDKKMVIAVYMLLQVAAILLFAVIQIGYQYQGELTLFHENEGEVYTDSDHFENLVVDETKDLMTLLMSRSNFETNGMYDPERVVDIVDYVQKDIVTGEITHGVGYHLKDLLAWSQKGIIYKSEYGEKEAPIVEEYTPIGYDSIWAYVEENGGSAADYYYYLSCTVDNIWDEVWNYNQYKNKFGREHTNLQYCVESAEKIVKYTNTDLNPDQIKDLGAYVILDFEELQVETSLSVKNTLFLYFNRSLGQNLVGCKVTVGIDTTFPVKDLFREEYQKYTYWEPVMQWASMTGILSMGILMAGLSYIGGTAGHDEKKNYEIDRIPVELLILFSVLFFGLFLFGGMAVLKYLKKGVNGYLAGAFCAIGINTVCITCFTCLVRRIRRKTLAVNSLLVALTKRIRSIVDNRQSVWSTIFCYLVMLLANLWLYSRGTLPVKIALGMIDLGIGLILVEQAIQRKKLLTEMEKMREGVREQQIDEEKFTGTNRKMAVLLNHLENTVKESVQTQMKSERLKADLITNVSHDIKTPLTSIINYVDLMKREKLQNEKAEEYLEILEQKSQRLKALTEDLVEASKISSGNIELQFSKIDFRELVLQTNGEFEEKFETKNLRLVFDDPGMPLFISADGRRIWRVLENLYGNVAKYAMEGTRVYAKLVKEENNAVFVLKNISAQQLNIDASELTERFVRGDISRSTEGSGLGLSIAQNLTKLMGGTFEIYLDGDLFRVTVVFECLEEEKRQTEVENVENF